MFRKTLTRPFSPPVFSACSSRPMSQIRLINFLTKPKRPCKRATLRSSFGPSEGAKGGGLNLS